MKLAVEAKILQLEEDSMKAQDSVMYVPTTTSLWSHIRVKNLRLQSSPSLLHCGEARGAV